jgi:hypothetical protein
MTPDNQEKEFVQPEKEQFNRREPGAAKPQSNSRPS